LKKSLTRVTLPQQIPHDEPWISNSVFLMMMKLPVQAMEGLLGIPGTCCPQEASWAADYHLPPRLHAPTSSLLVPVSHSLHLPANSGWAFPRPSTFWLAFKRFSVRSHVINFHKYFRAVRRSNTPRSGRPSVRFPSITHLTFFQRNYGAGVYSASDRSECR
jgi:hypothetical protein